MRFFFVRIVKKNCQITSRTASSKESVSRGEKNRKHEHEQETKVSEVSEVKGCRKKMKNVSSTTKMTEYKSSAPTLGDSKENGV